LKRVVVTGLGIVSCIGNNKEEVVDSLREGRSGIEFCQEYADMGFRSHIHGAVKLDITEAIDRRQRRFMGDGAAYNYIAMEQAIADSGLEDSDVSNERTGLIMGSGGPSVKNVVTSVDALREKGSSRKVGPFMVPRAMSSTNSATLATPFKIKGVSYSITSACSTSAHCIGTSSPAAARNCTGRFRCCSTPCRRSPPATTTRPRPPRGRSTSRATASSSPAAAASW
jgi:3-oxoacyl-[acyl-carrier-protein] synthase-1